MIRPIEGWIAIAIVMIVAFAVLASCEPAHAVQEGQSIVVETIMMEAANQGEEGMVAVAEVIRNRAKRDNRSMMEVVLKPKQFSCWNSKKWAVEWLERYGDGQSYQKASKALEIALGGSRTVSGATLYHSNAVQPSWAKSRLCHEVAIIGNHVFYTEAR